MLKEKSDSESSSTFFHLPLFLYSLTVFLAAFAVTPNYTETSIGLGFIYSVIGLSFLFLFLERVARIKSVHQLSTHAYFYFFSATLLILSATRLHDRDWVIWLLVGTLIAYLTFRKNRTQTLYFIGSLIFILSLIGLSGFDTYQLIKPHYLPVLIFCAAIGVAIVKNNFIAHAVGLLGLCFFFIWQGHYPYLIPSILISSVSFYSLKMFKNARWTQALSLLLFSLLWIYFILFENHFIQVIQM